MPLFIFQALKEKLLSTQSPNSSSLEDKAMNEEKKVNHYPSCNGHISSLYSAKAVKQSRTNNHQKLMRVVNH